MKNLSYGLLLLAVSLFNSALSACNPESDSSAEVRHCKVKFSSYSQTVHVYIPQNSQSDFAVHFHGHNLEGYSHFDKRYGDYGSYLSNSKAGLVLFVPESAGNCTTYDQFFADKNRAASFFNKAGEFVKSETGIEGNAVALSGHSGAYRVLNRLMGYANSKASPFASIRALGLFDATYGALPEIEKWVKTESLEKQDFLFYNTFITGQRATAEEGSHSLERNFKNISPDKVFFVPVSSNKTESLLDQHFFILKRGSLELFWKKAALGL